ncbi:hypothetical protein HALLA_07810 [Halostagnicola larsenii XH-48]|uniref:Uncharacterized protein n=1 Tax=Halostagnicola larsenii XH-48 TaxID=797299 RepID=W0JQD0_9EURY|nr:hypothetical protein [Halostagnicola larsenii]AHG00789.1 hypothetical protein HALLA_07810 [Halostagnicola larsenii XH-48]
MRVLDLMLGRNGDDTDGERARFTSDRYDVTYTVSADSHEIAYVVPIRRAELEAFADLVDLERETPYADDGEESPAASLESVLESDSIDADAWTERMQAPRQTVEPILEHWLEFVDDEEASGGESGRSNAGSETDEASETGGANETADADASDRDAGSSVEIVYLPVETESAFAAFFQTCRKRADQDHDPFELPDDIATAAGVLTQIKQATDRPENRVVVNQAYVPQL